MLPVAARQAEQGSEGAGPRACKTPQPGSFENERGSHGNPIVPHLPANDPPGHGSSPASQADSAQEGPAARAPARGPDVCQRRPGKTAVVGRNASPGQAPGLQNPPPPAGARGG